MTHVASRNTSRKRLRGNEDAPDEQSRSDNNNNNNNNENGSGPEQIETLRMAEAAMPFFGLLTKKADKADLALIDGSLARLREDVEQRVTLEDSKKVNEKIDRLTDDANADRSVVSQIRRTVDTKAASADLDRVDNALKMQQDELQSMKNNQKRFATSAALRDAHQQQATRDADLKKSLQTVENSLSTMQDKQKQFATSAKVQTSIGIQNKAREDGLEELKRLMLDKIEETDQSLQVAALKAEINPLYTRLETVENGFMSTKISLTGQIATVGSYFRTRTHEVNNRIGTVETILETSTAEYKEVKRRLDGLVNQMNDQRKERANFEEEVRCLRQDLEVAEIKRQRDRKEFKETVERLRQDREAEKRAHAKTAAQLINMGNKVGELEAKIATVKDVQDELTTKIGEDVDNKIEVYTADSNDYITAQLLTLTETMKEYFTERMTADDENIRKDFSRYFMGLQEESGRAAEMRLEEVRKNFEDCTAQLNIRLTENAKALIRYGEDVEKYAGMINPISTNINTLEEKLANHHRSLQDGIQEHFVQAKVHTDKAMRQVNANNINRLKSILDCIDRVKTIKVGVLETQMHESQAQQRRLAAEQNGIKEELDTQKKQHDTLKTSVEESRKEVDERHDTLAVMVNSHDSFLVKIRSY